MRPLLLDLFCGAGGCAVGYHRAGFDVVGVDICPQPRYPFKFHQQDAIDFLAKNGRKFAFIHASPPCKSHTNLARRWKDREHADYIAQVRAMLNGYAVPWVIENVYGAPLCAPLMLCGSMFGLRVRRHRWFESNNFLWRPSECRHAGPTVGVYGHAGGSETDEWKVAMGIDWMTGSELAQAIPPRYTEWIGRQLKLAC